MPASPRPAPYASLVPQPAVSVAPYAGPVPHFAVSSALYASSVPEKEEEGGREGEWESGTREEGGG
eukprot:3324475-Rhodomonas_salina.1